VIAPFLALSLAVSGAPPPTVGMVTRDFVDESRRNWEGTAPRPLRTAVWYPTDAATVTETIFGGPEETRLFVPWVVAPDAAVSRRKFRYPLVVMSHGTGGSALMMMWLGSSLAAQGYVVAAVNHHGNTASEKAMDPRGFLLYWERARDLSLVIDRLLSDPKFGTRIDPKRIGAAGFSLGGFTVIEAAGGRFSQEAFDAFCRSAERDFTCEPQNEFPDAASRFAALRESDPVTRESLTHSGDSFRDPRVRAAFVIAPALGSGFTKAGLRGITVPIEIVVGAADSIAPVKSNAKRYATLIPRARITVLPANVGHYTFLHECTPRGKQALPLCRDGEGVDRAAVHRQVARQAADFFGRVLRSAD
jgi:predicted dienelactone hydrolase